MCLLLLFEQIISNKCLVNFCVINHFIVAAVAINHIVVHIPEFAVTAAVCQILGIIIKRLMQLQTVHCHQIFERRVFVTIIADNARTRVMAWCVDIIRSQDVISLYSPPWSSFRLGLITRFAHCLFLLSLLSDFFVSSDLK